MNGEQKDPLIQEIEVIRQQVEKNHNLTKERLQELKEEYDTLINTRIPVELTRILLDEIEPLNKEIQTLQEASALLDSMICDDDVIQIDFLNNTALQVAITLSSTSVKAPTFHQDIESYLRNYSDNISICAYITNAVSVLKEKIDRRIEELNARLNASNARRSKLVNARHINPSHFRPRRERFRRTTIPPAAESQNKRVNAAEQKRKEERLKKIEERRKRAELFASKFDKLNKRAKEVFRRLTESI